MCQHMQATLNRMSKHADLSVLLFSLLYTPVQPQTFHLPLRSHLDDFTASHSFGSLTHMSSPNLTSGLFQISEMYNPNVMTDTERMTPPMIQAMREELEEAEAPSSHDPSHKYTNAFTMDEIQYLGEMPLTDRFEPSHRPPPGANRNILHAAAIFDPKFSPTPTYYQLPPRSRRCNGEKGPSGDGLRNAGTHRRNDSGYESGVPLFIGDDDEDDDGIDAWCDAVLAQGPLVEPNQHVLRPDAPSFRPGVHVDSGSRVGESRMPFGKAILIQDEGGRPVLDDFPDNGPRIYSSSIAESGDERDFNRQGRFALVLDYEGVGSTLGRGVRDTQSEGAESDDDEKTYDDHFEEGSRTRWSV